MSVLINLALFPVDRGASVSAYVAKTITIIKDSGLPYTFGAMGTAIEGDWDEVMSVVTQCFNALKKKSDRVYMTINMDYRKGKTGRILSKITSVTEKLPLP